MHLTRKLATDLRRCPGDDMITKAVQDALLKEVHKAIEEATESVLSHMEGCELSYPPGVELAPEEAAALSALQLSPSAKSGLRKLVADACCYPMFHFFSLLDGVADPDTDTGDVWCGATLAEKPEGDDTTLHDELYESYWLYKKDG